MKEASYLIDYGDLLARFCLSFVFLWSGVSRASTMPIPLSLSGIVFRISLLVLRWSIYALTVVLCRDRQGLGRTRH
jgi:hypothetical protein